MFKSFNTACDVQLYRHICEERCLQPEVEETYHSLMEPLTKLYAQILEYQARVICHLSKVQLSRAWESVTKTHDWVSRIKDIEEASAVCGRLIPILNDGQRKARWESQLLEMRESRKILHEISISLECNRI